MAKVKGTVFRAGQSKFGFYVKLDGDEAFYNSKYEPKCGEGDVVGIEFVAKGKSKNITKLVVLEKGSGASKASSGGGSRATGGGDRQDSIVWQHSQEIAARLTSILVANGAVELPAKGADKRSTAIVGTFDALTYVLFTAAIDPRESAVYKAEAGVAEDAEEEEKEDEGWDVEDEGTEDASWD